MKRVLLVLIRFYQKQISPAFPSRCRFSPTCSEYMVQALRIHGPVRGLGLGLWRILRCNPFSKGGYDPVPPAGRRKKERTTDE